MVDGDETPSRRKRRSRADFEQSKQQILADQVKEEEAASGGGAADQATIEEIEEETER